MPCCVSDYYFLQHVSETRHGIQVCIFDFFFLRNRNRVWLIATFKAQQRHSKNRFIPFNIGCMPILRLVLLSYGYKVFRFPLQTAKQL